MPYTPDTWADLDPTKVVSAARMTKLGGQYAAAMADTAGLYGKDAGPWLPSTAYAAGQFVISPVTGDLVSAKTAHTSGSTYSGITASGNWNPSRKTTMNAADYGVVGNGTTDDAAALNTLLSSAATFGASVTLTPGSTVLASSVTITVPSGTRLDLNGATIKSALPGTSDRLMTVSGVSNVSIRNGILDGNKAGFGTATEQRHNLLISNSSSVTVQSVRSHDAKGDGIYVGDNVSGLSSNIKLDKVLCDANWRQGMSISHVDGMVVVDSDFINTSGTAPQSGVDIEPNVTGIVCQNVKFIGCRFTGNTGSGVQVTLPASPTVRQGGFDFYGCTFSGNTADGLMLSASNEVRVIGGEIIGNTGYGVHETSARFAVSTSTKLDGVEIRLNGLSGVAFTYGFDGLSLTGCTVRDNGQTTANTYYGVALLPTQASANARIAVNRVDGTQQKYGLTTNSSVSNLMLVGNQYPTFGTAATALGDDLQTRIQFDQLRISSGIAANFFSGSGTTLVGCYVSGDSLPRVSLRNDGVIRFGSGTALDISLSRTAANVLALDAATVWKTGQNVTGSRPAAATVGKGAQFYDTTLNKPIWSDGTNWKDAAGTTV